MRTRTIVLIGAIMIVGLLALGSTVGAMTMFQSGWVMGNYPYGMMGNQQGHQGMMGNQQHGTMMGGYQQNPSQQGTPVTGMTYPLIQNYAYQPANMQVPVGTTVTWTNRDTVPHSVTFKNGMKDSGLLVQGQTFSYRFSTPGTYQYYCTVHPSMVATVIVGP